VLTKKEEATQNPTVNMSKEQSLLPWQMFPSRVAAVEAFSKQPKPTHEQVLALFVKHGGKLIDSSPMYGNAEGVIGDHAAKSHLRNSLFIATKVWTKGKEEGIAQMQRSLERFQTRTISNITTGGKSDGLPRVRVLTTQKRWAASVSLRRQSFPAYML